MVGPRVERIGNLFVLDLNFCMIYDSVNMADSSWGHSTDERLIKLIKERFLMK